MAIVPKNQIADTDMEIQSEATKWLVQQYFEQMSETDTQAFFAWLDRTPKHRHIYESMERMWSQLTEGDTLTMDAVDDSANEYMGNFSEGKTVSEQDGAVGYDCVVEKSKEIFNNENLPESLRVSHKPIILAVLVSILLIIASIFIGHY